MKRTLAALQRDVVERQQDDALRAQILREEAAEKARQKEEKKVSQYAGKWNGHLEKWDAMGLSSLGARGIAVPRPLPVCAAGRPQ